jgi:hypothetical protein
VGRWGIDARGTPALAAEVSRLAALLGSVDAAPDVLVARGVKRDTQTGRPSAYRYGARARLAQQSANTAVEDRVAGRRVGVSREGGRRPLRDTQRGPKTQTGRWRDTGAGRASPVRMGYVVATEGQRGARLAPVLDAMRQGPEAGVALLRPSWPRLGITQAAQGLGIADGAPWLWHRGPLLVWALGWAAAQGHERLAFEHAAPHRGQVAALRTDWRAQARRRGRHQQRRGGRRGPVAQVMAAVRDLCRGRNRQALRPPRDSFVKPQSRMGYAERMALPLPIGSGAIERTVRRGVNLRLKGPSLFWCRASAEAMLLLRSYDKAGRWNLVKRMATAHLALLEA